MNMFYYLLKCFYLMLPGILANTMPVVMKNHFKKLAIPVDFNWKFRGKPVFGKHKTYRGFIFGIAASLIIIYLQGHIYQFEFFRNLSFIDYTNENLFLVGFLVGFGVLFGDLVESFFKRRLNIAPGKPFVPWDQLDAIVGGLVFVSFVYLPPWHVVVTIIVVGVLTHILFRHLGYYLNFEKTKW